MSTKVVNYSPELTAIIVAAYTAEGVETDDDRKAVLESLSAEHGKSVKSLRAKLVREKVYVKQTYKPKTGGKAETKDEIVQAIAKILDVTEAQLGGLENATKTALTLIREQFAAAHEALAEKSEATVESDTE